MASLPDSHGSDESQGSEPNPGARTAYSAVLEDNQEDMQHKLAQLIINSGESLKDRQGCESMTSVHSFAFDLKWPTPTPGLAFSLGHFQKHWARD